MREARFAITSPPFRGAFCVQVFGILVFIIRFLIRMLSRMNVEYPGLRHTGIPCRRRMPHLPPKYRYIPRY